jgi:hypothetical protein
MASGTAAEARVEVDRLGGRGTALCDVAIAANGTAYALWTDLRGKSVTGYLTRRAGNRWSGRTRVFSGSDGNLACAGLVAGKGGKVEALWWEKRSRDAPLRLLAGDSVVHTRSRRSSNTSFDAASNAAGEAILVLGDRVLSRTANGRWSKARRITGAAPRSSLDLLSMTADGRVVGLVRGDRPFLLRGRLGGSFTFERVQRPCLRFAAEDAVIDRQGTVTVAGVCDRYVGSGSGRKGAVEGSSVTVAQRGAAGWSAPTVVAAYEITYDTPCRPDLQPSDDYYCSTREADLSVNGLVVDPQGAVEVVWAQGEGARRGPMNRSLYVSSLSGGTPRLLATATSSRVGLNPFAFAAAGRDGSGAALLLLARDAEIGQVGPLSALRRTAAGAWGALEAIPGSSVERYVEFAQVRGEDAVFGSWASFPLAGTEALHHAQGRRGVTARAALADQARGRLDRQRAAEVVALGEIAAERLEVAPRILGLDALGDDAQAEVVGELDGRAHDRGVGGVDGHLDHERLVDLDHVDRQALEVGQ